MTVNQRIGYLKKILKISQRQFSNETGINEKTISSVIIGENLPSLKIIIGILSAYPQINPRWLVLGEGLIFNNSDYLELNKVGENQVNYEKSENSELKITVYEPLKTEGGILENLINDVEQLKKRILILEQKQKDEQ